MRTSLSTRYVSRKVSALLAVGLLAPGAARAQVNYKVQPIVAHGDTVAGVPISRGGPLMPGMLTDTGRFVFRAHSSGGSQTLILYADGAFTPLVVGGRVAPGGKWPPRVTVSALTSMNPRGDVVFIADLTAAGKTARGTFRWDARAQQLVPVAVAGMPAVHNLTFLDGAGGLVPAINNRGEIVFGGQVPDAAGAAKGGVFFLGSDGKILPVLLPDQGLPGGMAFQEQGGSLTLSDSGALALRARRQGDPANVLSAYLWEQGGLTPLAVVGAAAPGGATILKVSALRLNNQNRKALLVARLSSADGLGLYWSVDGQLAPAVVPGQEMPGGGRLRSVLEEYQGATGPLAIGDISRANEAGDHAFLARLEDGTRALYVLDASGKLAFVLKQGSVTERGEITSLLGGRGIGLNSRGQVAVAVQIAGGPETILLLTPTTP